MEHKPHPKPHPKATPSVATTTLSSTAATSIIPPVAAPAPKPEPKPVGPKLDDATLEHCADIAMSYVSRNTTQHTPRDLLAYEIAAAIRAKKGAK